MELEQTKPEAVEDATVTPNTTTPAPAPPSSTTTTTSPTTNLRQMGMKNQSRSGSMRQSMSDLFRKARGSFVRTKGAAVKDLRGASGADFEGPGRIHRGAENGAGICSGCCWSSNPMVDRYLVVKGPFCFVFVQEDARAPQYAIPLAGLLAEFKGTHSSSSSTTHPTTTTTTTSTTRWTVVLRTGALGDVEYELSLASEDEAQRFVRVVQQQAAAVATDERRKQLGHGHLIKDQRASIKFAQTVAIAKEKDQPDKPISRQEILQTAAGATHVDGGMGVSPPL